VRTTKSEALAPLRRVTGRTRRDGVGVLDLECGHDAIDFYWTARGVERPAPKRTRCDDCLHGRPTVAELVKLRKEREEERKAHERAEALARKVLAEKRREALEIARMFERTTPSKHDVGLLQARRLGQLVVELLKDF
jgi:hypothetical protein